MPDIELCCLIVQAYALQVAMELFKHYICLKIFAEVVCQLIFTLSCGERDARTFLRVRSRTGCIFPYHPRDKLISLQFLLL
jgi:hypothetical protein